MSEIDPRLAILRTLMKFETRTGPGVDRRTLHAEMDALQKNIEGVPDPVLRTEYLRRLAVLRGGEGKVA